MNESFVSEEVRVNLRRSAVSGRYEYSIESAGVQLEAENQDGDFEGSTSHSGLPIQKAVSEFYSQISQVANNQRFINILINDYANRIIKDDLIKRLEEKGVETVPSEGFEKAFSIKEAELEGLEDFWNDIERCRKARNFLGPMNLMNLASIYDVLVANVLKFYFKSIPQSLNGSGRALYLSDLRGFENISDAETFIIDKEIDAIMYESHQFQINWFDEKLKINAKRLFEDCPKFYEIFERRNIIAHTSHIVNKRYIDNCKKFGVDNKQIPKIGSIIDVEGAYFRESTNKFYEFGIILSQAVWRKVCKRDANSIGIANETLINYAKFLKKSKRYRPAARILEVGHTIFDVGSELNRRNMIIEQASCFAASGDLQKAKNLVGELDWSSSDPRLRLHVSAINNDLDSALALMSSANHDGKMKPSSFAGDAIFSDLVANAAFKEKFKEVYGKSWDEHLQEGRRARIQVENTSSSNQSSEEKIEVS